MTQMPLHEAMCRTLAAVLGHDLDTEETAADIIAGLNAAGYLIAPFEPHECICPRCGIRHGGFTPQDGTAVLSKTELPADEVRGLSREFASGIGTHRCLAAESGDAGGQQQRHAHDDRYAPPRHART